MTWAQENEEFYVELIQFLNDIFLIMEEATNIGRVFQILQDHYVVEGTLHIIIQYKVK